jgi:putative ABC transport system substrate-binding protein
MKRRDFITLLGGAAAAPSLWPLAARTQQAAVPLVGYLNNATLAVVSPLLGAFWEGLHAAGYVENKIALVQRHADGDEAALRRLAQDLVRLRPDVILANSTPATLMAREATASIPIVGLLLTDPVGFGLIASEARPATNVTGILFRVEGQAGKQLEIARDLVPGARRIGALINFGNPAQAVQLRESEADAAQLGISLVPIEIRTTEEIGPAFQRWQAEQVGAVVVFTGTVAFVGRRSIAAFGLASRLPTVFSDRDAVAEGGLISYGISRRETYRRAAYFVDRILKGDKPADLPVEFPSKLELVINMATAKALGLTVPPGILIRADEVLE